jgi:hypothetical protein
MECCGWGLDGCPFAEDIEFEYAWNVMFAPADTSSIHPWAASALLDGLDVRDVTEAGG